MQSVHIQIISALQPADAFYAYLKRPAWFKAKFQPVFDALRRETGGVIIIEKIEDQVLGHIYVDCYPKHRSFGKQVPIFGWLDGDSAQIIVDLLRAAEMYTKLHGFGTLRGPINVPKMFGGWGVLVENYNWAPLIDSATNRPELAQWITQAEYQIADEYFNAHAALPDTMRPANKFPEIEFISYPIPELIQNQRDILEQVGTFISKTFGSYLPDTSVGETETLLSLLAEVPNGQDYYLIALEKSTRRVVGFAIEMPNMFDAWQGQPITSTNVNSVLVAKEYRGTALFYRLYEQLWDKLNAAGITAHIGGTVWAKNKAAMQSFAKISYPAQHHVVFEKYF